MTATRVPFLRRRLGYSSVGSLVIWLAVIMVFAAFFIFLSTQLPTD
jgi:hypothetical protein